MALLNRAAYLLILMVFVAMTSPSHQSGTDRIAEVARKAKQFDLIINIQGDEPLTEPGLLDRFVETLRSDRKIDLVTAAHPFTNAAEASSPHQRGLSPVPDAPLRRAHQPLPPPPHATDAV